MSLLKFIARQLSPSRSASIIRLEELTRQGQTLPARRMLDELKNRSTVDRARLQTLEGDLLFQEHRDVEAETCYRAALKEDPGLPSAHNGLSTLLAEQGQLELATMHSHFAVAATKQKDGRYLAQLGYCQLQAGNLQAAEAPLRAAVRLSPEDAFAWNNLGIIMMAKGRFKAAISHFERSLRFKPDLASAHAHLSEAKHAIATHEQAAPPSASDLEKSARDLAPPQIVEMIKDDRLDEALALAEKLALEQPANEDIHILLLYLHEACGDIQSGLDCLDAWASANGETPKLLRHKGLAYARAQEFVKAEKCLTPLMDTHKEDADLHEALGTSLARQEKYQEATAHFHTAASLEPDNLAFLAEKAANLCNACRYEEAYEVCQTLEARGAPAITQGIALAYLGRFDEALAILEKALKAQPRDPNLRLFRSQILLLNSRFEDGWQDYNFRNYASGANIRALPFPLWRNEPLSDKSIIVLAEQGLGDQIMFSSCIPDLLKRQPARVIIESIDRIAPILTRSFPECEVVGSRQNANIGWVKDFNDVDYFIPMGDLPSVFRNREENFPQHNGYLKTDGAKVQKWRSSLDDWEKALGLEPGRALRIGFSWRGGTAGTRQPVRSLDIQDFLPLMRSRKHNTTWVCLQYGQVQSEVHELTTQHGQNVAYWPESIADLDEFAALIQGLDLVITVCNTTVHFAGGLGQPVWILSPKVPEWRYGLYTLQMPWYPSSKIYRQIEHGQWEPVMTAIAADLADWQST